MVKVLLGDVGTYHLLNPNGEVACGARFGNKSIRLYEREEPEAMFRRVWATFGPGAG